LAARSRSFSCPPPPAGTKSRTSSCPPWPSCTKSQNHRCPPRTESTKRRSHSSIGHDRRTAGRNPLVRPRFINPRQGVQRCGRRRRLRWGGGQRVSWVLVSRVNGQTGRGRASFEPSRPPHEIGPGGAPLFWLCTPARVSPKNPGGRCTTTFVFLWNSAMGGTTDFDFLCTPSIRAASAGELLSLCSWPR
jgi:hypothetical protein